MSIKKYYRVPVEAVIIIYWNLRNYFAILSHSLYKLVFDSLISQINFFDRLTASRDFKTKLRMHLLYYIHSSIHFYLAYTYTLSFIITILYLFYYFIVLFCSIALFESLLFLLPFAGPKPVVTIVLFLKLVSLID